MAENALCWIAPLRDNLLIKFAELGYCLLRCLYVTFGLGPLVLTIILCLTTLLKRNKYVGILSIAVTTLQYITISMITIFSMYIAHVR